MNAAQAKKVNLPDLMSRLGYMPDRITKGGYEYWYKSPFRDEKEASFHTSFLGGKWIWNDFGDEGGTVIEFVMRHEGHTSVSRALAFLTHIYQPHLFRKPTRKRVGELPLQNSLFSFQQQNREAVENFSSKELEFIEAHPVRNRVIYHYLEKRGIRRNLVALYLQEIRYRNSGNGKEYFAFGMKNIGDGYEIRAASDQYAFKSALKTRDVSLIRGRSRLRQTVSIFEGMTDFLSLLMLLGTESLQGDALILHSLSSYSKAVRLLEREDYQTLHLFLDNNPAGEKGAAQFLTAYPHRAISHSKLFAPHGDLNDALLAGSMPQFGFQF